MTGYEEFKKGMLVDQILSDMGQLMKDSLNNLYNAIQDLGDPHKRDDAIAVIKHSFYNLVRLSENQIAVSLQPDHVSLTAVSITGFVQDAIAAINETLGDKGITVELTGNISDGGLCNIHPQKFTHLLMLFISNAVNGMEKGATVTVNMRFADNTCYIGVPVSEDIMSLYDSSSYLTTAGTPKTLDSLENLMLAKIINNFNDIHESRVFTAASKSGNDIAIIAIKTVTNGIVGETQPVLPGLRPDLIFLSDILDKTSYT